MESRKQFVMVWAGQFANGCFYTTGGGAVEYLDDATRFATRAEAARELKRQERVIRKQLKIDEIGY